MPNHVRYTAPLNNIMMGGNMAPQKYIQTQNQQPKSVIERFTYSTVNGFLDLVGSKNEVTPKQSVGWFVIGFLLALIIIFFMLKSTGWWEKMFSGKYDCVEKSGSSTSSGGMNVSPKSHLQYFFF
jgi:hypothetical protein